MITKKQTLEFLLGRNRQLRFELQQHKINAERLAKELDAVLSGSEINFDSVIEALDAHDELFN